MEIEVVVGIRVKGAQLREVVVVKVGGPEAEERAASIGQAAGVAAYEQFDKYADAIPEPVPES